MLNVITHGTQTDAPPALIVHGLYGSARNWNVIAKRLSDSHFVIAVDMRNHGNSPWFGTHSYADMADDLAEVITAFGDKASVIGHSMGGKAAMVLALTQPDLVSRLLVADIAPVTYTHDQTQFISAMRNVDLSRVERRADAMAQLAQTVEDPTLQSFFTQSLDVQNKQWRLNLDVLERDMHHIVGFPDMLGSYDKMALFLAGANSDYIKPEYRAQIRQLFPAARFAKIPNAGHWLHAEQPRAFEATVRAFLAHAA